jgi:hypothetical protein
MLAELWDEMTKQAVDPAVEDFAAYHAMGVKMAEDTFEIEKKADDFVLPRGKGSKGLGQAVKSDMEIEEERLKALARAGQPIAGQPGWTHPQEPLLAGGMSISQKDELDRAERAGKPIPGSPGWNFATTPDVRAQRGRVQAAQAREAASSRIRQEVSQAREQREQQRTAKMESMLRGARSGARGGPGAPSATPSAYYSPGYGFAGGSLRQQAGDFASAVRSRASEIGKALGVDTAAARIHGAISGGEKKAGVAAAIEQKAARGLNLKALMAPLAGVSAGAAGFVVGKGKGREELAVEQEEAALNERREAIKQRLLAFMQQQGGYGY